ncbi:MAG TPA: ABC transporter permease subunit [Solirubrobacteraceae bacterium]|nr:ABC transporter permease subunit [Solirubrobacteraceae bacterium]
MTRALLGDRLAAAASAAVVALTAFVLLVPALLVAVLSFSDDRFFDFPPHAWGFHQYRTLLEDPRWGSALWLSARIATPVALLAALVVVPTLFTIHRSRLPFRGALQVGGIAGIILPISAYAVAMYGLYAQIGLLGTYTGLVLANLTLAIPVMLLVTSAAMSRIPPELELAAMVAGASRLQAWLGITLRLLAPAIMAGGVLAFVTSLDEAVLINFLGGPALETLPKAILDSVRYGLEPVITAIATLLMVGTSLAMALAARLARRGAL